MYGPNPATVYPMRAFPRVVYLKNVVTRPNIEVGDYSYYDDPEGGERFEERNVLYNFDFVDDRLIIGRFVAIARGAQFIMNGANHVMGGLSTYPFNLFGGGWEKGFKLASAASRGDTVVGNDVWIGSEAVILPGVSVGNGAIIGAYAVVGSDIPSYSIAVGNPARVIRVRFDPEIVATLNEIAWWDWPAERITRNLNAIRGADIEALKRAE